MTPIKNDILPPTLACSSEPQHGPILWLGEQERYPNINNSTFGHQIPQTNGQSTCLYVGCIQQILIPLHAGLKRIQHFNMAKLEIEMRYLCKKVAKKLKHLATTFLDTVIREIFVLQIFVSRTCVLKIFLLYDNLTRIQSCTTFTSVENISCV